MSHTFTRRELYELVWSEPMKTLSGRFGLSDVGLAKACRKANIPRPPRGYWAKLRAGKRVLQVALPDRGPGMANKVEIAKGRNHYYHRSCSKEEILNSNPQPPVFEDDIEDVASRVRKTVRRVPVLRIPDRAHHHIQRLLDEYEARRQKQLQSRYPSSWDKPLFADRFEKRRLRILNAIITALAKAGMKPYIRGQDGRELGVQVNDTTVCYTLDATSQKSDPYAPCRRSAIETRGPSNKLRCAIERGGYPSGTRLSWEDTDKEKLESHLTDIVVKMIVSGERQYREYQQRHYEWLVERKTNLIEEIRRQKEEAEQRERERLAALEKARVDRLLRDAQALRQAEEIRAYVATVRARWEVNRSSVSEDQLNSWSRWALNQADQIDPMRSGQFANCMEGTDATDGCGES